MYADLTQRGAGTSPDLRDSGGASSLRLPQSLVIDRARYASGVPRWLACFGQPYQLPYPAPLHRLWRARRPAEGTFRHNEGRRRQHAPLFKPAGAIERVRFLALPPYSGVAMPISERSPLYRYRFRIGGR